MTTDVDKLLWLHQVATELGSLEQSSEYTFAGIGDLDLIKAVAIDVYQIDGDWNEADTNQRVRTYKIAQVAITSFVRQILECNMNQITAVTDTRANLELARAFADAKLVPDHFKKSVGDCYIAVNLAGRYGMDPWTLMQELYIVNGRPMMSGKLAIAILNHSLAEPLRPIYSGAGDEREITLSGRPEGESEHLAVKLKVKDARTANEQWKKNPDQMLMYSASRTWGRRFAPDILLGIVFDDEEIPGVNAPAAPPAALAPAPGLKPQAPPLHDPETGEIIPPHEMAIRYDANNQPETFKEWRARFMAAVRTAETVAEIAAWNAANADNLIEMKEAEPKTYAQLEAAINAHRNDIETRLAAAAAGEG